MEEVWLSAEGVTAIEKIAERTFWYRLEHNYYETVRHADSTDGGRGGKKLEIALSSLSVNAQQTYLREKYGHEPTARELAEQFRIHVPLEKLDDPRMASKVRMVVGCLALPEGTQGRKGQIREIAEGYGYNVGTAYRLLDRVKKGKPLLAKRKGHGVTLADLGITVRAWDERAVTMAVGVIMDNRRRHVDGLTLYTELKDTAGAEHLQTGSYSSFMTIKKRIDESSAGTRRDKGTQGLRQDVLPAIRRDPSAYRPMECLVGDQHKADYYAIDSSGKVVTLELFCWMDFRTQLVWGSIAYKHYNRYTVGQALINAVRWGLPSTVYTDWGKPEKSNYMALLIKQLTGLGIKTESIEHVKATPRHPQAKPLEGFFGNFDGQLRNARIPGYCKRLKDTRENELQQKELGQLIKANRLLSTSELTSEVLDQVQGWNEHIFKNRREDTGTSPLEIYKREVKNYPVTSLSEDVLEYFFLPVRKEKIKNTSIKFKHEWLGVKVFYDRDLADYNGCRAEVRYDPFDPWRVWVFVDGELVCEAAEWEMINPKISDQVSEKMAEQKGLAAQITESYKKYLPPKAPVRRINPAEKQARELTAHSSKERTDERGQTTEGSTIRVMETSLERQGAVDCSPLTIVRPRGKKADPLAEFRKQFHPGASKPDEPEEYKPLFKLSMGHQVKRDDGKGSGG